MELIKDLGMKFPTKESKRKYRFGLYKCHCGAEVEAVIKASEYIFKAISNK